jgi:hypothetical protein
MANEPQPNKIEERTKKACEAYGIDPAYLLSSSVDPDTREVVLLTHGGKRVVWSERAAKIVPLTEIEVTGLNRELEARRAALGK